MLVVVDDDVVDVEIVGEVVVDLVGVVDFVVFVVDVDLLEGVFFLVHLMLTG